MTDYTKFQLNPLDVGGNLYKNYNNDIKALSIVAPAKYFKLRKVISEKLINAAVGNLYLTVYHALTSGNQSDGTSPLTKDIADVEVFGEGGLQPSFPSQLANKKALEMVGKLEDEMEIILNTLLPLEMTKVASEIMSFGAKADIIGTVKPPAV